MRRAALHRGKGITRSQQAMPEPLHCPPRPQRLRRQGKVSSTAPRMRGRASARGRSGWATPAGWLAAVCAAVLCTRTAQVREAHRCRATAAVLHGSGSTGTHWRKDGLGTSTARPPASTSMKRSQLPGNSSSMLTRIARTGGVMMAGASGHLRRVLYIDVHGEVVYIAQHFSQKVV